MKRVHVAALGIAAPGLSNWSEGARVLRGEAPFTDSELPPYQPGHLAGNERRRATRVVRLAFRAAEDAAQSASIPLNGLAAVFATSDGDLDITSRICAALAEPGRIVSPTDFHNSVHNAAAGYWSIGTGAEPPSTTVAGHDYSFAIGLLEAMALVSTEGVDTLLVAFDSPPPEPLYAKRPIRRPAGVALILTAKPSSTSIAALEVSLDGVPETCMDTPALEELRLSSPAARALPLFELIAKRQSGAVGLARSPNQSMSVRLQFA